MKNTAKFLIVALFFIWGAKSIAQPIFGIKAGLNMSTMLMKDDDGTYSDDYKSLMGFHVGPTAEFPINDMFSFETGLMLSTKGFKYDYTDSYMGYEYSAKTTTNLMYIDIPLTAKATFDMGGAKLYGLFGPYIGMGIGGKIKAEVTVAGDTESDDADINWGSGDDDDLKPLDFGVTVGAGLGIKSFEVGLGYALGMANLSPSTDGGAKISNRVLSLSLGYKFGKK
jgi:hypothetical protein